MFTFDLNTLSLTNLFIYYSTSIFQVFVDSTEQLLRKSLFLLQLIVIGSHIVCIHVDVSVRKLLLQWSWPCTMSSCSLLNWKEILNNGISFATYRLIYPTMLVLLVQIIIFFLRVVLSPWLHLIIIIFIGPKVLIGVIDVLLIHQFTIASTRCLTKAILSIITTIFFFIWLVFMTFLMHHLPGSLQSTICYFLLCEELLCFSHRSLFLFLHFEHLLLVLKIHWASTSHL